MRTGVFVLALCAMLFGEISSAQTSMLDLSFGSAGTRRDSINGRGGWDDRASAVAVQPNGKIVVAGRSGGPSLHWTMALARYDTDGTLDSTFGTKGTIRTYISGGQNTDDEATSMVIQPDGKIVVGGYTFISSTIGVQFAAARFDTNGVLDNGFGGQGGTVRTAIGGVDGLAQSNAIALQPDGKLVLAGFCEAPPLNRTFALARFYPEGVLDPTFGSGGTLRGKFNPSSNASASAQAVAVQKDGKILIAGTVGGLFGVARFDTDGTPDNSFGVNGVATTMITGGTGTLDYVYGMVLQPDGRIVLAGWSQDTSSNVTFAVARLNADGTADSAFGSNGSARNVVAGSVLSNCLGYSVALQNDGKIVMAGTSYDASGNAAFAVMRFDTSGNPDDTFGTHGTTRNFIAGGSGMKDQGSSVALQGDGKIVAAGSSDGPPDHPGLVFAVARYLKENPPVAVRSSASPVPASYSLSQNYPNPFNPTTTIEYSIPVGTYGHTSLRVYDILGREVSVLVNEREAAGTYTLQFDGSGLSSGVYFYQLIAGTHVESRKMVLMK